MDDIVNSGTTIQIEVGKYVIAVTGLAKLQAPGTSAIQERGKDGTSGAEIV